MKKNLVDKVLEFIGFEETTDEEEEKKEEGRYREESEMVPQSRRKGQVVSLHAQRQMKVVVVEPKTFEDVQVMADHLKNRRPLIINLEQVEGELARRVVDFISGATYALNGNMQKVGNGIFLFVPSNVDIFSDLRGDVRDRYLFTWTS